MHQIVQASSDRPSEMWALYRSLEIHECDECGAAVSDPDLHIDWHEAMRVK